MKRLILIHKNLFIIINKIIKAKTKPHEKIYGLKSLLIAYIKEMLNSYVLLFRFIDPTYLLFLYKKYKQNALKRDLNGALKFLKRIQYIQKKRGMSRQEQKQFWRDFIKNTTVREDMFDKLEKELK